MEISAISSSISVQSRDSQQSAERITTRAIEARDIDGDNRLNVDELGRQSGVFNKVDSNGDNFADQQELFTALAKRLEERNNTTIEISIDINVIKASLGSLLASAIDRADSDILTNFLDENATSTLDNQVDSNVRERYINALITAGIDDGGVFGSTNGLATATELRDSVNSLSATQIDGRQLLLNLLIEELGTPRDEATAILDTLQNQPFQTVA
jgi:hypothetical protein